jgi:urate oxidase
MAIVLGANRYGKAETRVVRVTRDGATHGVDDLSVSIALDGDRDGALAGSHLTGDNSAVLPTDSQKNTVYAFAQEYGVGQIESFALRLARHFVESQPSISHDRVVRVAAARPALVSAFGRRDAHHGGHCRRRPRVGRLRAHRAGADEHD